MNLARLLRSNAETRGAKCAIFLGERPIVTYSEMGGRVARLAGALRQEFGLHTGDRVAICMKNCPEYVEVLFATWWAGLIAVPVNAKLHPREVAYILENSGSSLCFCPGDFATLLSEVGIGKDGAPGFVDLGHESHAGLFDSEPLPLQSVAPDDPAWLFYTSGTTGKPKGAELSHRNLMTMILGYLTDVDNISQGDRWLVAAPFSHGCGLYALPFIARGCSLVVTPSGAFKPSEVITLINSHPGMSSFFVPTMIKRLLDDPSVKQLDLQNLKTIVYGGGPMYVEECLRALELLGPRLVQIYGQGESPMTITCLTKRDHQNTGRPDYLERLGSVGRAQLAVEVCIVDEQGRVMDPGETGEIIVRGDTVMSGYWQNPLASGETIKDGWLFTGDLGVMDEDGYLTLKDRSKDVIISGGSNIYPREVEEVLLRHPQVHEVAVIGRAHADWGEEVVAFVVATGKPELLEPALDRLCRENLARFKRPRWYAFESELPKNAIGKVMKTMLREKLQ